MNAISIDHATSIDDTTPRNLRIAFILGLAGAIGAALVIPYVKELMPEAFAKAPAMPVIVAAAMAQSLVLFTALSWIGLRLGQPLGLDAPLLRRWTGGNAVAPPTRAWRDALLGAGLCFASIVAVTAALDPHLPAMIHASTPPSPTPLQGVMASFYGGIAEEIQIRLFLLTVIAAVSVKLGAKAPLAIAVAIVIAALLFGAGHLPAAAKVWPMDVVVVVRTMLGNSLAGLVFGWLFVRYGLEAAIVSHFSADLLLHGLGPMLAAAPGG